MKLAIIGGRNFSDKKLLDKTINDYFCFESDRLITYDGYYAKFQEFVSGGAIGADKLGEEWVKEYNNRGSEYPPIKITIFKPEYDKYPGKIAPLKRNETIIKNADFVLAFWDGVSTGTANALGHAKKLKKSTMIIYY